MSRFFGKPLVAHFIARQRHITGHTTTPPAAEHGDPQANFAVAGGNGAGVAMVSVHSQAAMVAKGLVVARGLLQGDLQLGGDLAFQLGFQVVQQSPNGASPVGRGRHCTPIITKPPKTKRYRIWGRLWLRKAAIW